MFDEINSIPNLLQSWQEFLPGKKDKPDVSEFTFSLSANIYELHLSLSDRSYVHAAYKSFKINDPKPRDIHKAIVRDRLLHHAIHRILYFIFDSYSSRLGKGTHKAMNRFRALAYKVSKNHTRTGFVLKCDIKKFFASIDHTLLKQILARHIQDQDVLWLLDRVIDSFSSTGSGKGLPLGNLTSQLLTNIYMNEFDQFVKHGLKIKYYIRYADDFVVFANTKEELENTLRLFESFLQEKLKLNLHPDKVFIKTLSSGVDFLGWVHFTDHRVLRTATKRRMLKRLAENPSAERVQSYLGLLSHGNANKLRDKIGRELYH